MERVAGLLEHTPHRVTVRFAEPVDPAELREVPGVSALEIKAGRITFRVTGDLDPAVKAIARHPVADLEFAHPTLEEVFLTYYEDTDGAG